MPLTDQLSQEYQGLFNSCIITPDRKSEVESIVKKIVDNKPRYEKVSAVTGVPWFIVGVIHSLEADLNFHTHLHNGDPLSHRTTHVPAGRPLGNPPFTWEASAIDALQFDHMDHITNWDLPHTLYRLEGYNGFGYRIRHPNVLSPYLWAASNHYTKGKFTDDGKFDDNAVSSQIGAATLLHLMQYEKIITL